MTVTGPVLFYDGECKFCDASVMFILRNENEPEIKFGHLQQKEVREFIEDRTSESIVESIYFFNSGKIYKYADATIQLSQYLKSPYKYLLYLKYIPKPIRNFFYKLIARYRKRFMGTQQCIFPKVLEGRIEDFQAV